MTATAAMPMMATSATVIPKQQYVTIIPTRTGMGTITMVASPRRRLGSSAAHKFRTTEVFTLGGLEPTAVHASSAIGLTLRRHGFLHNLRGPPRV